MSHAQNREDVVLHRALAAVRHGRYVDVGAQDPTVDSISRAFYDLQWRGITVDPVAGYADRHRDQRPGDITVQAAITEVDRATVVLHEVEDTGLSTLDDSYRDRHEADGRQVRDVEVPTRRLDAVLTEAGWQEKPIHFMTVDTEGTEEGVLRSLDLHSWRPWILVVEATLPNSTVPTFQAWEPIVLAAGYRFCLFDGVSRFYLADEHHATLTGALSYPACARDSYVPARREQRAGLDAEIGELRAEIARLDEALAESRGPLPARLELARARYAAAEQSVRHWREQAVQSWSTAAGGTRRVGLDATSPAELQFLRATSTHLEQELVALRQTASWRVSRPLRTVRGLVPARGRRR